MVLRIAWLVLGLFVMTAGTVQAAIVVERFGGGKDPVILLLKGDFELSDDPQALSREVSASGARIISFNSDGGNIKAAMAFGRMIRSLGLTTIQLRASQCASACALAFLGGTIRIAEPGSIGVHQSSFSAGMQIDGQAAVAAVQEVTADIMSYMIEMGVDPKLLQLSLSVPSTDMRYLTASEMQLYKVTSGSPSDLPAVAAAEKPAPVVTTPVEPTVQEISPSNEDRARAFMEHFQDIWSRPNAEALAFLNRVYADTIVYYGNPWTRAQVMDEKQTFAERWPQRAYSTRFGSVSVSCNGHCTMSGLIEWFVHSPIREKTSSGIAEFILTWDPVTGKVVGEGGKVITLDKGVVEPVRIVSQWHDENGRCRGGSGDSPDTTKACERRSRLDEKLAAVGWCYGRPGDYGNQTNWQPCDGNAALSQGAGTLPTRRVDMPSPGKYPARGWFFGRTVLPDFKGRDRAFKTYRTRISDGMKEGPNYAGHYSVIQIGCGTGCSFVIVGNNRTGQPMRFPRGGETNMYLELKYQKNSRLLLAKWADYEGGQCYIEAFDFDGKKFKALDKKRIGNLDACYAGIEDFVR